MEETISCPKCSQLNTTRRTTCKSCGTNLEKEYTAMLNNEKEILGRKTREGIVIEDIQMPFGSMIVFMVKWALASIPAIIIVSIIIAVCLSVFTGILTGIGGR